MIDKRRGFVLTGLGVIGVIAAAIGVARVRGGAGEGGLAFQIESFEGWTLSGPPGPISSEDRYAITHALASRQPLPSGWHRAKSLGRVHARPSGLVDPSTGEVHIVLNGMDESPDLEVAEVLLDGQVVSTASRANGQITDRSGFAFLTQSFWVPDQPPFTVELKWYPFDGDARRQWYSFDGEVYRLGIPSTDRAGGAAAEGGTAGALRKE